MAASVLLLPSPLLPAEAYESLASALRSAGLGCAVADPSGARTGAQLVERWALPATRAGALVAHSNAGLLAPSVRAGGGRLAPIVFMDAALPPASGGAPLVPSRFRDHLAQLSDPVTGALPPWTRWWPREEILATLPAGTFDSLDQACPSVPLSYFDSTVSVSEGWVTGRNAYLAFGDTYADELAFAREWDWPAAQVPGTHLQFLHDPATVARQVSGLIDALST